MRQHGATAMPKLGFDGPWNGYEDSWISTSLHDRALASVTLPALRALTPSRADLEKRFDEGFAEMACWAEAPMGEVVSQTEAMRQRVESLDPVRYGMFIAPMDRLLSYVARESRSRARHEAFRVRLALEAHALDTGAYPDDLETLVPGYLLSLPRDPITGEDLLYRLSDGRPQLYSRGWDRDDDGGRREQGAGHSGEPFYQLRPDGDWVFFR